MACLLYLRCCCLLLLALVAQSVPQSSVKLYLYTQLENALVSDGGTLQVLRELFIVRGNWPGIHSPPPRVSFNPVYITVDSISPTNCSTASPVCSLAFCPVSERSLSENRALPMAQWELCSTGHSLNFFWSLPTTSIKAVDLIKELAKQVVPWYSNGLSIVLLITEVDVNDDESQYYVQSLHLSIKSLACMPDMCELNGALGELLTWVLITQS